MVFMPSLSCWSGDCDVLSCGTEIERVTSRAGMGDRERKREGVMLPGPWFTHGAPPCVMNANSAIVLRLVRMACCATSLYTSTILEGSNSSFAIDGNNGRSSDKGVTTVERNRGILSGAYGRKHMDVLHTLNRCATLCWYRAEGG